MAMNKKGLAVFVAFMLAIVFFVLGMALAPPIKQTVSESMLQLDCSNSSISNQDKAVCTQLDFYTPLFTGVMFGLAGFLLGGIAIR